MEGSKFCSTQWLIDISNIDVFIAEYMGVHVSPTGPTGEIFDMAFYLCFLCVDDVT